MSRAKKQYVGKIRGRAEVVVGDPFARWQAARAPVPPLSAPRTAVPQTVPTAPAASILPTETRMGHAVAPDLWLAGIAARIRAALADGAARVADSAGHLVLVRPVDGRHLSVAPHILAELAAAGLLPDLPAAVAVEPEPDPIEQAERAAIQAEPSLPPEGTQARAALDRRQARMVAGLLEASRVRPSCFPGEAGQPPPVGAYCSACKGRRWWWPRHPKTDGTGPSAHWRCRTCRPPPGSRADLIVEVVT